MYPVQQKCETHHTAFINNENLHETPLLGIRFDCITVYVGIYKIWAFFLENIMEFRMKKHVKLVCSLLIVCFLSLVTACSDNNFQDIQSVPSDYPENIVGIIEKVDSQLVLMTEENDYLITGMDLSQMVGKKTKLTGMVTENEGQFTITVSNQKEVTFDES